MIKKEIKVKPKKDDINHTMFLSVFSGFELQETNMFRTKYGELLCDIINE